MKLFIQFLLKSVYQSRPVSAEIIELAFAKTVEDVNFHFPFLSQEEIKLRIIGNRNELALYLFRLGNVLHEMNLEELTPQIHWLLKQFCSCEIYFNNSIGKGFYIVHGEGTIIGSRNTIGEGFKIHQGCTIGHKRNGGGNGNRIGENVTLYANSSIIGEVVVGDNVIIGTHVLITTDISSNKVITVKKNI